MFLIRLEKGLWFSILDTVGLDWLATESFILVFFALEPFFLVFFGSFSGYDSFFYPGIQYFENVIFITLKIRKNKHNAKLWRTASGAKSPAVNFHMLPTLNGQKPNLNKNISWYSHKDHVLKNRFPCQKICTVGEKNW